MEDIGGSSYGTNLMGGFREGGGVNSPLNVYREIAMEHTSLPLHSDRHVMHHFPVAKLPPELRNGFKSDAFVHVTVVEEKEEKNLLSLRSLIGSGKGAYPTPEDAVSEIRKLRNEWDD